MRILRSSSAALMLVVFIGLLSGCESPSVSSGAGSDSLCDFCTEVVINNNTNRTILVSGSGKERTVPPNGFITFKYRESDHGERIVLFAQRLNTAGVAIGPTTSKRFFLHGGTQEWVIDADLFE